MEEKFIQFLKDNNFFDGWKEGYRLDNEIHEDDVPFEDFFEKMPPILWLYSGPGVLAGLPWDGVDKNLKKRWLAWREKWLSTYEDLDEEWMMITIGED